LLKTLVDENRRSGSELFGFVGSPGSGGGLCEPPPLGVEPPLGGEPLPEDEPPLGGDEPPPEDEPLLGGEPLLEDELAGGVGSIFR
jgi:hypothetical protein